NRALAGGASCVYPIRDASHTMTRHSVTPVRGVLPLLRRLQTTYLPPQYLPYVTNWLRRFRVFHWIYRKVIGAGWGGGQAALAAKGRAARARAAGRGRRRPRRPVRPPPRARA